MSRPPEPRSTSSIGEGQERHGRRSIRGVTPPQRSSILASGRSDGPESRGAAHCRDNGRGQVHFTAGDQEGHR